MQDICNVEYSLVWAFIILFKVHVIFFLVIVCHWPKHDGALIQYVGYHL